MPLPDQLADAGKEQLAKQIDFFQAFTARAFDNAERILALNVQTTRAALDQTSGAMRQLAGARDPRDLLALTGQTQHQVEAAMAYGRKLFEIANAPAQTPAAPQADAHIVAPPPVKVSEVVVEAAAPVAVAAPVEVAEVAEPAAPAIAPSAHPLGEADPVPTPVVIAKTKAIARAASKVAATPLDAPHPAASPMPEAGPVAIPAITPVDAVAAPHEAGAPPPARRAKGGRKH